jgi:hypothetical protein
VLYTLLAKAVPGVVLINDAVASQIENSSKKYKPVAKSPFKEVYYKQRQKYSTTFLVVPKEYEMRFEYSTSEDNQATLDSPYL